MIKVYYPNFLILINYESLSVLILEWKPSTSPSDANNREYYQEKF